MIKYIGTDRKVFALKSGRDVEATPDEIYELMPGEERQLANHPLWLTQVEEINDETEKEDEQ